MVKNKDLLVHRLINKDKEAFGQVYQMHLSSLIKHTFRFLDTKEESAEIVQDAFVKFWNKCSASTPDSAIKSYLYRFVHNLSLNNLKHQKVKNHYKDYSVKWMEKSEDPFSDNN